MTGQHAPLPPSGAPQWGHCSGSIMANMQAVDTEHPRTRAGTASHWVASECLARWVDPNGGACFCADWTEAEAPNGVIVDDEMVEGAQIFVDHVLQIAQKHGAMQRMLIEHRVAMPHIHAQNWGTLDLCIPLLDVEAGGRVVGGLIYMLDYKFGHRENKAFANLQLIDYLAGICNEYNIDGAAEMHVEVVFQIVQPFCYHGGGPVDEWRVCVADLRGYINQLTAKAYEAFDGPTFSSGPHCRDCLSIGTCATARKSHYSLIDYTNDPCVIDSMTGQDLAVERALLKQGATTLGERLDAIDAELRHRIGKGEDGGGLALESGEGNLAWTVPPAQAVLFAKQLGIDAGKPAVLTPTQTLAKAPKEMKGAVQAALKAVTKRPTTGLKLIKAADSMTARAFSKKA
jgi:hypothetical protein